MLGVCVCVCVTLSSFLCCHHSLVLLDSCFSVGGVCPREKTNLSRSVLWGSHIHTFVPSLPVSLTREGVVVCRKMNFLSSIPAWHRNGWVYIIKPNLTLGEHQEMLLSNTTPEKALIFWRKSVISPKHSLFLSLWHSLLLWGIEGTVFITNRLKTEKGDWGKASSFEHWWVHCTRFMVHNQNQWGICIGWMMINI